MWIDNAGKIVRMEPGELPVPILRERMQRELVGELRLRQTAERKKKVQALRTAIDLTYDFDYEPSPEEIQGRGFVVHGSNPEMSPMSGHTESCAHIEAMEKPQSTN
jgi:hypothetical protein